MKKLIIITGPTASGKTALAIKLAKRFNGEIISADSRAIYKGIDIASAKPSLEEREGVTHWGFDLVEPDQTFTAADFKDYAFEKISEIHSRGKIPFLVGGTGLYIDAIVFDFAFAGEANEVLREQLEQMNVQELQKYCENNNIKLPENDHNKRYLIRAIERKNVTVKRRETLIDNTIVVGITTNRETLRTRIALRSEQLFANNVVEEATILGKKYSWDSEAMTGNVYPLVRKYIAGELDETGLRREFEISDWRLAKRQMTWLRRNPYIMWGTIEASEHYLSRILVR